MENENWCGIVVLGSILVNRILLENMAEASMVLLNIPAAVILIQYRLLGVYSTRHSS